MLTAEFLTYWAMVALSLFNTMVLFWLGYTVWLNAEKRGGRFRQGGIWLATIGLMTGGIFFATHTAMLDYQLEILVSKIRFWWYFFFAPIILMPHSWYLLMLWYAGFWDDRSSDLHYRHRYSLIIFTVVVFFLLAILFFVNPFGFAARSTPGIRSMGERLFPYVAVFYPLYIMGCNALSFNALLRPAPSGRMMGDLARRRARPWLLAATVVQIVVSVIIGLAFCWVVLALQFNSIDSVVMNAGDRIDQLDFVLTALLALTIVLAGKAIVSYEIFTGKTLPRRGFLQQWRGIVTLATLCSTAIAWCIASRLEIYNYPLLIVDVLVIFTTAILALLSWRFFREREEIMEQLRPFAASQHLYEAVLSPSSRNDIPHHETRETFAALCEDVLETRGARLVPLGALAPLVQTPLFYPDEANAPALPEHLTALSFPPHLTAINLGESNSAGWAIPLRSNRGLIGILVVKEKRGGALFAEEEIALAQAGSERLLDALAGAALASRLMELQRQRMNEAQLADGQSTLRLRRALHDEILPRLHAAMLQMNGDENSRRDAQNQLTDAHRQISGLLRDLPSALPSDLSQMGLFGALQQSISDDFTDAFDGVQWEISPQAPEQASRLSPLVAETLFHAAREVVRNAARHARGEMTEPLYLLINAQANEELRLIIEDNGVGLAREIVPEVGGHGLALHSTMLAVAGGSLAMESLAPHGTRVTLTLPLE